MTTSAGPVIEDRQAEIVRATRNVVAVYELALLACKHDRNDTLHALLGALVTCTLNELVDARKIPEDPIRIDVMLRYAISIIEEARVQVANQARGVVPS